jgi:hypothetical protein
MPLTIESLPLRRHIDEMVGCVHPRVEDEVRVGGEVATGQEQASVELLTKVNNFLLSSVY